MVEFAMELYIHVAKIEVCFNSISLASTAVSDLNHISNYLALGFSTNFDLSKRWNKTCQNVLTLFQNQQIFTIGNISKKLNEI